MNKYLKFLIGFAILAAVMALLTARANGFVVVRERPKTTYDKIKYYRLVVEPNLPSLPHVSDPNHYALMFRQMDQFQELVEALLDVDDELWPDAIAEAQARQLQDDTIGF